MYLLYCLDPYLYCVIMKTKYSTFRSRNSSNIVIYNRGSAIKSGSSLHNFANKLADSETRRHELQCTHVRYSVVIWLFKL